MQVPLSFMGQATPLVLNSTLYLTSLWPSENSVSESRNLNYLPDKKSIMRKLAP